VKRELAGGVAQPAYRREDLRVGIVHIGVGNFHRAHQAMYLDRLLNQGEAAGWAICGVGLLPVPDLVGRVDALVGSWDMAAAKSRPVWDWPSDLRLSRFFSAVH